MFRLDFSGAFAERMRELARGLPPARLASYTSALKHIHERLAADPMGWGEQSYRLRGREGVVCVGIRRPVLMEYVVYELERLVLLRRIELLPA